MSKFPFDTAELLSVPVHSISRRSLLAAVQARLESGEPATILYVNAHCLNIAQSDPEYREVLRGADLVYADGIGAVWASRALRCAPLEKVTGRAWIDPLCALAAARGWKLYILAGRPGVAQIAASRLMVRWPGLQIVGVGDGYFKERSEASILAELERKRPHILLVGMNTPAQEKWLARHREQIRAPICWAVGALFDTVAGLEPTVPGWLDALALEWLWRLAIDPRGKWRRYLVGIPVFVSRVLYQRIRSRPDPIARLPEEAG